MLMENTCREQPGRPRIMGILNVTPDSFYAHSRNEDASSIENRVRQMLAERVDIIDIGAYSTRPGADDVPVDEEIARLDCAVNILRKVAPQVPTSVDTFRAVVARHAVECLGVGMVNDISGGMMDANMFDTIADLRVPYVLMHSRGTPATMQQMTDYGDAVSDVLADLRGKLAELRRRGVDRVIIDPGFGFAKTVRQNYRLMAHLSEFRQLGAPLLVGVSRKSMIYRPLGLTPEQALNGTTALNTIALMAGADYLRVHDVWAAAEARAIVEMVKEQG